MRTIHVALFLVIVKSASIGFGLVAAFYWYRSSKIPITPVQFAGPPIIEPFEQNDPHSQLTIATIKAFQSSSALNTKAALWTAASVAATTLSTVLSNLA